MQAKKIPYLEGILLVYLCDWRRESSELVGHHMDVVRCVRPMTRAAGVLGGVDESEDGSARRGHGRRVEWRNYVFLFKFWITRPRIRGDDYRTMVRNPRGLTREGQLPVSV
jgi:hypothetical protein